MLPFQYMIPKTNGRHLRWSEQLHLFPPIVVPGAKVMTKTENTRPLVYPLGQEEM